MIENKLLTALKLLTKKLEGKNIKWIVVGSLSLALQGVKIKPKDIDILTNRKGAYRINSILKEYEVKPVKFEKSKIFSSYLGKFRIKKVKVEVMGNLKARVNGKWVSLMSRLKHPQYVKIKNAKIPVSRLEEQLKVYAKIKRNKNPVRVRKIEEFLKLKYS